MFFIALDELSRNREIVLKIAQRFDGNLNEVNYDGESPLELAIQRSTYRFYTYF